MAEVRLSRKLAVEFLGTAALVFCGPGTAAATFMVGRSTGVRFSMADLGVIALAFMMVIVAMIYTIGHISGCHINPAVTLALAMARKARWSEVPGYLTAQFAGGAAGAFAIWSILEQPGVDAGLGVLSYAPGHSLVAFVAELIGTFLLVLVVFGTTTDSRATPGWYGLAIPSIVFAVITVVGPVTGAALNPARYLGPMIARAVLGAGKGLLWNQVPVYVAATFAAGLLAAGAYAFLGGVSAPRSPQQQKAGPKPRPKADRKPTATREWPRRQDVTTVDAAAMQAWIGAAAQLMDDNAQYLTHLDAVIGDSDHGTNMRRGFQAAAGLVDDPASITPGAVLDIAGQAVMSHLRGPAGPLYRSGFPEDAGGLGGDPSRPPGAVRPSLPAAVVGLPEP